MLPPIIIIIIIIIIMQSSSYKDTSIAAISAVQCRLTDISCEKPLCDPVTSISSYCVGYLVILQGHRQLAGW